MVCLILPMFNICLHSYEMTNGLNDCSQCWLLFSLRREFGSCSALSTLKRLRNLISPPLRDLLLFFCRPSLFRLTERQWRPSLPFPLLSSISLSALYLPLSSPGLQSGNAFLPLAVPPCVRKAQSHTKTQLFPNSLILISQHPFLLNSETSTKLVTGSHPSLFHPYFSFLSDSLVLSRSLSGNRLASGCRLLSVSWPWGSW